MSDITGTDSGAQGAAVTPRSVVAGLGVAGAAAANAATPSCGASCINPFAANWGSGAVWNVKGRAAKAGTPVILFEAGNFRPAEDFTYAKVAKVKDLYAAGLASAALNLHYGNDTAYEIEYSPYGAGTGLCVGAAKTAVNGTAVVLKACGVSSKTLWVADENLEQNGYHALINGSTTNFSHPFVLTNKSGSLSTHTVQSFSDGTIYENQLWGFEKGVL
jgi:hypothetical protein